MRKGSTTIAAGDTLIIRASNGNPTTYVSTSAAGSPIEITAAQSGSDADHPTTIRTLPEEERMVVIKRDTASGTGVAVTTPSVSADVAYLLIRGLVIDGLKDSTGVNQYIPIYLRNNTASDNGIHCTHHVRIENCEIRHSGQGSGIFVEASTNNGTGTLGGVCHDVTIQDCDIHDNGAVGNGLRHNIYLQGYNHTVDGCNVYSCLGGLGLQVEHDPASGSLFTEDCSNNTVQYSLFYDNAATGCLFDRGDNNLVHDCAAWGNTSGFRSDRTTNTKWYHLTAYGNTTRNYGVGTNGQSTGTLITNCIAFRAAAETNLSDDNGSTFTITTCINIAAADTNATDPLFTNAAGDDFTLQSGSPARDAGTNLGISPDLAGNTRPQGSAVDIGAYEYVTAAVPSIISLGQGLMAGKGW